MSTHMHCFISHIHRENVYSDNLMKVAWNSLSVLVRPMSRNDDDDTDVIIIINIII